MMPVLVLPAFLCRRCDESKPEARDITKVLYDDGAFAVIENVNQIESLIEDKGLSK